MLQHFNKVNKDASDPEGTVARKGESGRQRSSGQQTLHLLRGCGNPVKFFLKEYQECRIYHVKKIEDIISQKLKSQFCLN